MSELDDLTLPELLDRLADLSVPEPVPYTPETIGWWVLAAIVTAIAAATTFVTWRRRRSNRYRRAALRELNDIRENLQAAGKTSRALSEAATLVRRTALAVYPREEVTHLHGEAWAEFLTSSAGRDLGPGVEGLVKGPYAPSLPERATDDSMKAARVWIEAHRA